MKVGDLLKYTPTSSVGKVTELEERDGRVWARLDFTDLWYDSAYLVEADPSEYIEVSFKERRFEERSQQALEEHLRQLEEADNSDMAPTGGG